MPVVAVLASRDTEIQAALDSHARRVFQAESRAANRTDALLNDIAPLFAAADSQGRIVAVSNPYESVDEFSKRVGLR